MSGSYGGAQDGLYTYDLTVAQGGPRVPDEEDLGGVEIENGDPPPQKGAERDGDMDNVQTATLAGLVRTSAVLCRLHVEYSGGSYVVVALDAMGRNVAASQFTPTVNGVGDVTWSWAAGVLPPQTRKPRVTVQGAFGHGYATFAVDSLRVFLADAAGTPTDLDFEVEIRG